MASYSAILRPLQHVRGVGEVGLAHDGPADVVRVQMSEHDSCDLVRVDTGAGQLGGELPGRGSP
jgi:hypothetical protein